MSANTIHEYSTCPEGKRDWFYTLFGCCFAKPYLDIHDKQHYHKVLCFKYTTDGKECCGLYPGPNKMSSPGHEFLKPDCFSFCVITINFIGKNICCYDLDY
jgi:hypothetical protein